MFWKSVFILFNICLNEGYFKTIEGVCIMKVFKRVIHIYLVIFIVVAFFTYIKPVKVSAADDFKSLLESFFDGSKMSESNLYNYSLVISALRTDGASDEVVAGIMCNIKAEAGRGVYTLEGYYGDKTTVDGFKYTEFEDGGTYDYGSTEPYWYESGGDYMGGAGHGLVQWTYREDDLENFYNENKDKYSFVTITHWIKHWSSQTGSKFTSKSTHTCHLADVAGQVYFLIWDLNEGNGAGVKDEIYSCTTAEDAAEAFCRKYERPAEVDSAVSQRRGYAADALKLVKSCTSVQGTPSATVGQSTVNMANGLVEMGLWNEDQLVDFSRLSESALSFMDRSDLNLIDAGEVVAWRKSIDVVKEDKRYAAPRQAFVFVGIVLVVWSILLYIAFWFDKINNFVQIQLLPLLSLGILQVSPDEFSTNFDDKRIGKKVVVHKNIIFIVLIGITLGVLLLTQRLNSIVNDIINWVVSLF